MCGICGIISSDRNIAIGEALLARMCAVIEHRGPDDSGTYLSEVKNRARIGLGHARLSIIDISGGHQPIANEDESAWIVYNGEVYNFPDLRRNLQQKGHTFATRTDTEVIVHLYEEKGIECLQDLRGMFAFALWDTKRRSLFLARDRLGQKPLCYYRDDKTFVFASEIKSILQVPGIPKEVNLEALHHYLTYQYVPHPLTMFKGISKLPPAHYLVYEPACALSLSACGQAQAGADGNDTITIKEYWRPHFRPNYGVSEESWRRQLREMLSEATKMRMIADVPLGAFLSGGIDSSVVVGLMSQLSDDPVRTFSIGFEEKKYDELDYARVIAKRFQTDHHEFVVRPNAVEMLPKLVCHYDEPFADSSAIPTFYVSQMTSQYVKVALTGDAGDECFAGYDRYKAIKLAELYDRLPGIVRRAVSTKLWDKVPVSVEQRTLRRMAKRLCQGLALSPVERYLEWICIFNNERKYALYSDDFRTHLSSQSSDQFQYINSTAILADEYERCTSDSHAKGLDFVGATTYADMMRYLPGDLLVKVDIASMAHSLEVRSPFLDHKVIELAAAMPTRFKLKGLTGKYILRKAFQDILPKQILKRPKMGFGVPIAAWFREELSNYLKEVLLDSQSLRRGYFRESEIRRLVREHVEGIFDHGYRLWALLILELWHQRFVDGG